MSPVVSLPPRLPPFFYLPSLSVPLTSFLLEVGPLKSRYEVWGSAELLQWGLGFRPPYNIWWQQFCFYENQLTKFKLGP